VTHADPIDRCEKGGDHRADNETNPSDTRVVDDGDDQHGGDVIDDG